MPELQTPQPAPQPLIDLRSIEEFVLKYPSDTLASLIVEQAQEVGIELEIRQVHRIRDQERQRTARTSAPSAPDPSGEDGDGEGDDGDEVDDDDDDDDEEHSPEEQGGHGGAEAEGAAGAGDGSAPKRRGRKPGGPDTKAGFVRSLPLSVPAKEVVALALEQRNFEITEAYVSAIRSKLLPSEGKRRRRRKQAAPVTPAPISSVSKDTLADSSAVSPVISPPLVSVGPAVSAPEVVAVSALPVAPGAVAVAASPAAPVFRSTEGVAVADVEEEFARLVLEIGLVRAEQLLGRFKERLARFVRE